jgi:hypothetical protein
MPRDLFGSLLTEVSRAGFGFRHLAHSRSGRPLLGALAQPAAVLRSTRSEHTGSSPVGGASRGYRTAARALVGKSYAPSAPHASQGTSQQEAAEGLRLAVVEQLLPGTERVPRRAAAASSPSRSSSLPCTAATSLPVSFISFCICVHAGGAGRVSARARDAALRGLCAVRRLARPCLRRVIIRSRREERVRRRREQGVGHLKLACLRACLLAWEST